MDLSVFFVKVCLILFAIVFITTLPSGDENDFSVISVSMTIIALVIGFTILLSGCSSKKNKTPTEQDYKQEAQKYYDKAMHDVHKGSCITATEKFEKVSEIYPYSDLAKRSSIMQIYCEYIQKNYESAASLADLHEKFYPYDELGDYPAYIKSLALFNLIKNHRRDIKMIENAETAMLFLLNNYQYSPYKKTMQTKIIEIKKLKYNNDLFIANFYFKTNRNLAAFKRVLSIKNEYQNYAFYNEKQIEAMYNAAFAKIL